MESKKRESSAAEYAAPSVQSAALGQVPNDYVIRVFERPGDIPTDGWNSLLALEPDPSPFMRMEYLAALHDSGCASKATGWIARYVTVWCGGVLQAACPLFHKLHSSGEYVFDWAWANAYAQHGLPYYPKGLVAIPFTPVPGARLLARGDGARRALADALVQHALDQGLSSLHLLFAQEKDLQACAAAGFMRRHTVQFHWLNRSYRDTDHFLADLQQEKRKKIRQERRKVADAGIRFRHACGADIREQDWDFFYRCYQRTYLEHGNAPYLSRNFFSRMARDMAEHWLLFVAERDGLPVASSLIALDPQRGVAYGRYWGALERVDCLHFEACYYQPLDWCIAHGFHRFEGGAQGEHKMARALMPVRTSSAHWLAHPAFADAVDHFLQREAHGIQGYLDHLDQRSPLRRPPCG